MKVILHICLLTCFLACSLAHADEQLRLRSAIDTYLDAEWGVGNVEWIELSMPDPKLLDKDGDWTLEGSELPRGRVVLYLNVTIENTMLRRIPFRIRVMPFAWVPVLVQPTSHGMMVSGSNIRWERREVTEIRHPWPDSPEVLDASSLRSKRSLKAGDVITWQDVERQPDVIRGDRVTLHMQRGSIVVETEGIALQDGHVGEIIRVEQEEIGSLLRVKVTGSERAEIINALGR
jgi:flagella basal body P-ring formation protein FlgA